MIGIEWAIDAAVQLLMPPGSCTPDRWLTFELEAENKDGSKFTWLAQYNATTNYVEWRTVIPGEPHVKISEPQSRAYGTPRWIPVSQKDSPPAGTFLVQRRRGEGLDIAPGFVITGGCHDSCWRSNALDLIGEPRVFGNHYTDRDGKQRENWNNTEHFRVYHDSIVRVKSITIEGPVAKATMWGEATTKYDAYKDGRWVNDTDLTGTWAILYGVSKLAHTIGKTYIEVRLDGRFSRGKYGTRSYKETGSCQHYRIQDGVVTHMGIPTENPFFLSGWQDVEPFILTEARLREDGHVNNYGKYPWDLPNLFIDLQPHG